MVDRPPFLLVEMVANRIIQLSGIVRMNDNYSNSIIKDLALVEKINQMLQRQIVVKDIGKPIDREYLLCSLLPP